MNGWQKPGRTPLHVTVLCGLPHTCSFTRDRKRDCPAGNGTDRNPGQGMTHGPVSQWAAQPGLGGSLDPGLQENGEGVFLLSHLSLSFGAWHRPG